ncbi:TonB-dependent receptor [Bdellovibrio bacteriovorus]|uniref:TonB-dependent receptor n=2 Tax=Bdellovibrio bacteriovorus TaxID=959 RepID=A0A150WJF0_BDEBC|nr:TonB-dependent receptor [Bdellovibrio bacteriovorus]
MEKPMKVLLASILFLVQTQAFAQESKMETIQVQGNKENKTYAESTESIAIVPSKELDAPNQPTSIHALNAIPNVVTPKNDNSFSIRGINNTGVTGFQKDNLASIIVDDVFQTDLAVDAGSFDLWDIHQAEVYRGPQSTSQGVNSLAGSILLYHNKANEQTEGAAKIGYGSYNKFELGAVTNNTWFDGVLLSRISYNQEKDDGFIKNIATDNPNWGRSSKEQVGLDLVYKINDADFVRLNTKLMQKKSGGESYVQSANPFDYEVNQDIDSETVGKNIQTSLRYFKKINDNWSNEIIAAYSNSTRDATADADYSANLNYGARKEDNHDRYYSVENLLKYQDDKVKNVLGFHAHDYYLYDNADFNVPYPISANNYVPIAIGQTTDKYRTVFAVFDSYLVKFAENQSINLGLRYEYTKNKYGASTRGARTQSYGPAIDALIDSRLAPMISSYDDTNSNSILLPKVAYIYEFNSQAWGVSYAEGYRTGGISINRARATTNSYDPEKTQNYELSYKLQQDGFTFSSNAFFTKWLDQQVQVKLTNGMYDTQVANAASSTLYGAEAEGHWKPAAKHDLGLGAGYVQTRFDDFSILTTNYTGNEFPYAPNWTGRLSYNYAFNDNWNATSLLRYLSKSYSDAENTVKSPEQFYLDLSAQYILASLSLTTDFYVQNVLDTQYVLYDHSTTLGGQTVDVNQVNSPREFGLRVSYFW